MTMLGSWLGLDGSDEEEQDPVKRALAAMGSTASSVGTAVGQGISSAVSTAGQDLSSAAGTAYGAVGSGLSSAASAVGQGLGSLVAPPTAPSPWDEPAPEPTAPTVDWSAASRAVPEALGAAARAELPAALESLGPGILRPPQTGEEAIRASMPAPARAVQALSDIGQAAGGELGRRYAEAMGGSAEPTLGAGPLRFSPQDVGAFVGGAALDPTSYLGGSEAVDRAVLGGLTRGAREVAAPVGRALAGLGERAGGAVEGALTPPVEAALQELGGGFTPRARLGREAVDAGELPPLGQRGSEAARYADEMQASRDAASALGTNPDDAAKQSTIDSYRALAAAGYDHPAELASSLETVPTATTAQIRGILGERPQYLTDVAQFLLGQRKKLLDGQMTPWDVAKAYYMTLMSMQQKARDPEDLAAKLASGFVRGDGTVVPGNPQFGDFTGLVNPRTGEALGDAFTETHSVTGERTMRPEGLGAAWLWTPDGQRARAAMLEGRFDPEAWASAQRTRQVFGSDTVGNNGALRPLTDDEVAGHKFNMTNMADFTREMNEGIAYLRSEGATTAEIGQWLGDHMQNLNGISTAKNAFIKQLLGMGDAVTVDAREINAWLTGSGLRRPGDTSQGALVARAASSWLNDRRVREAMAARVRAEVANLNRDYPELLEGVDPADAGEIIHHWIWDKAGGTETTHTGEQLTQRLAGGMLPSLTPGARAAVQNALGGAAFGAGTNALGAEAQGEEPDFDSELRAAGMGAGLGLLAGRAAGRDVGYLARVRAAATEASRMAAARDAARLGVRAPELAGSGVVPETALSDVAARLSPVGRAVHDTYTALTPARVESSTARAQQIASDAIAGMVPKTGGLEVPPSELVSQVHDAIVRNLGQSKTVMTGLKPAAIRAYLGGEGLTTKVDAGSLDAINRITQQQVNVGSKRAGQQYTLPQAAEFAQRESEQMRMATGGTRFPDPETGQVDTEAPRAMYAYVTDGQPLGGPNQPALWLVWGDQTPRITSAHHPYALGSPNQDIHATMPPGLKAALYDDAAVAGGRVAPGVMQGGSLVEAAPGVGGQPARFGWEGSGVGVGDTGRTLVDTHWLVGPEGEDAMRANGLVLSMPKEVQRAIAKGELTDPEQIAAVLQRGGSPQWKGGWAATLNKSRSESLVLDPSIQNVRAIYVTGGPDALDRKVPATAEKAAQNLSVRDVAERMRAEIADKTGQDIPIIHNDTSGPTPTSMADARVVSGPPTRLAPGRADIVDQYTRATNPATGEPYTDIGGGFVPRLPASASGYDPRLVQQPVLPGMEPPPRPRSELPSISDAPNMPTGRGAVPEGVQVALGQSFPEAQRALEQAQASNRPSGWEWLRKVGYSGLIGPMSAVNQAAEGLVQTGMGTEKAIARAVAEGRPGSIGRTLAAPVRAVPEGFRSMLSVLGGGEAPGAISEGWQQAGPSMADRLQHPLAKFAANALDYGTRAFAEAPDAFFRPIWRALGEQEAAERLAQQTGRSADDLLAEARAVGSGETPALRASPEARSVLDAGRALADDLGYKGDPGKVGSYLQRLSRRDDGVGLLASYLLPFPAMTTRALKATGRLVPGVGEAIGRAEGRDRFDRLHDQMLGAIGTSALGYYAANGGITGNGPDDPDQRRAMLAQGWQPNSVLVGGRYLPARYFGRWEPIIQAVGDVHDAWAYAKKDASTVDKLSAAAKGIGGITIDQAGLGQLNDLLNVLDGDLAQSGPGLAARSLTRYVPFGATLRQLSAVADPDQRRPIGWRQSGETVPVTSTLQQIEQQVGLRQLVPAAPGPLGAPLPNPTRGLQPEMTPDPMLRAFGRAGVGVGGPPDTVTDPATGRVRPLTQAEQARFASAYGRALREQWSGYGNPMDADGIGKAKARARDQALAVALGR